MDINKWKSLAINKDDHTLLVAIAKTKHRGPGPQFSKIFNDYLKFQAKREGMSLEAFKKKLLNGKTKNDNTSTRHRENKLPS